MNKTGMEKCICGLRRSVLCLFLCAFMAASLSGCKGPDPETRIVLTTGLKEDEVFRIESISCSVPEIMVYLTNMQNQYENVYGEEIWNTMSGDVTLEQRVKDNCLAKMAQVKTMNLMADSMDVALSPQEIKSAENAAEIYFSSLNTAEIDGMGINKDTVSSLYREYLLASKVYQEIVKDVNPEVSDDEARNITVDYILIRTYETDDSGARIEFDEEKRLAAYQKAKEAYSRATSGEEDFGTLIMEFSDSEEMSATFGKEDIESDYVRDTLFKLSGDEISPILTTSDGYMIAKCISTYDLDETDSNKVRIVDSRREEVFGETYDDYVETLTRKLNESLWDSITFIHSPDISTSDFFQIADENLKLDSL